MVEARLFFRETLHEHLEKYCLGDICPMKTISASDLVTIPIDQRIRLVEDIWDSITESPEEVEIPAWHKTVPVSYTHLTLPTNREV